MRRTVPSASLVTQTLPAPKATPYEPKPIVIFLTTRFVRGSIRPRTFADRSATQTLPAPYARPNGRVENAMRRETALVAGSIRMTRPESRSDVQTEAAADSTIPDCAPTGIFAIGSTLGDAEAIAAATAAAPSAAASARTRLKAPPASTSRGRSS